jgi:hypothetical protein
MTAKMSLKSSDRAAAGRISRQGENHRNAVNGGRIVPVLQGFLCGRRVGA